MGFFLMDPFVPDFDKAVALYMNSLPIVHLTEFTTPMLSLSGALFLVAASGFVCRAFIAYIDA
jgi:hypothetical protein